MSRRPRYPNPPRREDGKPSGWDRYLDLLIQNYVPEAARQWYVTRARQFIDGMRPDRLSDLTLDDITGYFQKVSDEGRLNVWQFRQMVEAVQLLVVDLAQVKCGNSVDWDYWKEALQTLPPDHPTLAREQSPEESVKRLSSGPRFAASGEAHPILTEVKPRGQTSH